MRIPDKVYTVVISEAQRAALVRVDTAGLPDEADDMVDQNFVNCLRDLPESEALEPGISHGLCY